IAFAEGLSATPLEVDEHGHARAVRFAAEGKEIDLPARSVLIAAGTQPNTVLAREEGVSLALDGKYFQACDEAGEPLKPERHAAKPLRPDVPLHRRNDGRFMSFFGDLHPSYFGNVVKAMGSAKQGYPVVSRVLSKSARASSLDDASFLARLNRDLRAVVHEVRRLTPRIVEVVLRAPVAARRFHPGQFYRMQNFETLAQRVPGTTLAMEGLALTGAWVDREKGLISVIALEMGGSAAAGPLLRRQHRPGHARLRLGRAGHAADPLQRDRPHHRHRLGQHDGRGSRGTARGAKGISETEPRRDRLDQQPHAMHDEGDLRAVPAAARRPADRQDELRVLLLQPGPAARPGRLRRARAALGAERRAGEAHRIMDLALPEP